MGLVEVLRQKLFPKKASTSLMSKPGGVEQTRLLINVDGNGLHPEDIILMKPVSLETLSRVLRRVFDKQPRNRASSAIGATGLRLPRADRCARNGVRLTQSYGSSGQAPTVLRNART